MVPVLIIGAGMAGLSAALALKRRNIGYNIIEAGPAIGGRAVTHIFTSGIPADLGAHWLHGDDNPIIPLLDHYHIRYKKDKARHFHIFRHGKRYKTNGTDWLDRAIDPEKAKYIKEGTWQDCPMTDLAVEQDARSLLQDFATMWNGTEPPLTPSAKEFLTDESTPGGLQPEGGMDALLHKMAEDVGKQHIHLNNPVTSIRQYPDKVCVEDKKGKSWHTKHVLFTGSLAVLQSNLVKFDPPLSSTFQEHLSGMVMGRINKIIVEVDARFMQERNIPVDMAVELFDGALPHFCHVHSAGLPLITLFVSGEQSATLEKSSADDASRYLTRVLKPIKELEGWMAHKTGKPLITQWISNPYIQGAYSACLPGATRSGPWTENQVTFCGDTFDKHYPASLAGAYLSGKAAANRGNI